MKAIGIDIGTTSVCGVVTDAESGCVVKTITESSNAFIEGCAEWEKIQSVEKIMSVAFGILEAFIDDDITAIGVTGQMHGIVYTDSLGNCVSPLYTWQDKRGNLPYKNTTYAEYLGAFSGYGNVTDFYNRLNGIRPENAVSYCTIQDYFVMKLCGLEKPLIHSTNAASFGCYDVYKNEFTCEFNGDTVNDYHLAGEYKGIPVSVAIGDNQASVFSTLADENDILVNVGTGSQISIITPNPKEKEGLEVRPYFENKYLVCGAALCGGRAYSILKDFYAGLIGYLENADEGKVYGIMNKMLETEEKNTLKVDTRFAGTRTNSDIKGSIYNITTENFTPAQLTRGVLEGMAEELYSMYEKMECQKQGVVGSGNGIRKNPALVKVFEEKFNSNVKIPAHFEEAAFGAALFALISCGSFRGADDIKKLIRYN